MKIIKVEADAYQSIIRRTNEFCKKNGLDDSKIELKILESHYFLVDYIVDESRKLRFQGDCCFETPLYGFSLIGSNNQEYNLFVKNNIEPTKENINTILDKEVFDMLIFLRDSGLNLSKIFYQKDKLKKLVTIYKSLLSIIENDESDTKNK